MYVIRIYKDYDNDKLLGFKVVDSSTNIYQEFSYDDMKQIIKNKIYNIKNVELDSYGNIRLKNLNPDRKIKYYKQSYIGTFKVNHYCIILGYKDGLFEFVADSADETVCSVISGKGLTLGEIANRLSIDDLCELRLYNAKIEKEENTYRIWVFKGGAYRKLPLLRREFSRKDYLLKEVSEGRFEQDKEWIININSVNETGLCVNYLEHKGGIGEAIIPIYISHLEQFGGNVNHIKIPRTLKSLGERCFEELEDLLTVKIGPGIKIIPDKCFRDSSIKSIKFSGREVEIGHDAFADCSDLKCQIITYANKIGIRAFNNSGIHKVILHNAVSIGSGAFDNCDNLEEVKLFNGLKIIGSKAFRYCPKLKKLEIPSSVVEIRDEAFRECRNLKIVKLPKGIKLGENVFNKKTLLEYY